uniref:Malic enzyme n=1 Tax=Chlamydomonas leiostraca TaxID=1034604 RepID=A0A7S0N8P9_9CHLO|mmetsp:Transcript_10518/g.26101  ORF Transcript_10518/g.26101 Transcript_10518/m.26101 type:complete len:599 (+) Transcript_10518:72-1868(+)
MAGEEQALSQLKSIDKPIEKYLFLRRLLETRPDEYYRLLLGNTELVLPFIYTPTVGEACERYHELPGLITRGLYLTLEDKGHILDKLKAWPQQNVRVIVVTDGERILGLGDLGAGGMGISEGKITLYTAAAGVDPSVCLPLCLDVGTNNEKLLADPGYKGLRRRRARGAEYDAFVGELAAALTAWRPHVLLQWEDFGNTNAFRLLERYRPVLCSFNDDIQGTAAITLAALLAAVRAVDAEAATLASKGANGAARAGSGALITPGASTGSEAGGVAPAVAQQLPAGRASPEAASASGREASGELGHHRVLFFGAGEAGTGIGELIAYCIHRRTRCSLQEARGHCFFMDSRGLVCRGRPGKLEHHKEPFAHDVPHVKTLLEAVRALRPTVLIGVSTMAGAFSEEVVREMGRLNARPIIFPLSNPTSKSECTFEQAMRWTEGRVVFASGSPFDPITMPRSSPSPAPSPIPPGTSTGSTTSSHGGSSSSRTVRPAQANNAYIFPALGYAAVLTQCKSISDECFLVAAETLAGMANSYKVLEEGALFPAFSQIRDVSARVMAALCEHMCASGLGIRPRGCDSPDSWLHHVRARMWGVPGAGRM